MTRLPLRICVGGIYAFLLFPLLIVFPLSVSSAPYLEFPPPGFSWQWYARYFADPVWIDATERSLLIATATMLIAVAIGAPLSFSLVRGRYAGRAAIDRLMAAPMIVPSIITSVAVYGLFAKLHLIGAWYGLALAHTVLALPFVVIVISAGLRGLDASLEDAAIGLGASRLTSLLRITLPQALPSIGSAMVLAFVASFDELVVAMFLSGANMTLPKKMFDNIRMEIDPTIAAVSVLQILLIALALALASRMERRAGDRQTDTLTLR